jgi:hypothetical protein
LVKVLALWSRWDQGLVKVLVVDHWDLGLVKVLALWSRWDQGLVKVRGSDTKYIYYLDE